MTAQVGQPPGQAQDRHQDGEQTGNRMLVPIPLLSFTVPRYLDKRYSGTAICAGTEAFILLDEHSLHSLASRYSGFQQKL